MRSIKNIQELEEELQRLQSRKMQLETGIRNDVQSIRDGLKPLRILGRVLSGFIRKDASHNDLFARGVGEGAHLLSEMYLLKGLPSIAKKLLSSAIGNVATNLVSSKTTPIASYIGGLISSYLYKRSKA